MNRKSTFLGGVAAMGIVIALVMPAASAGAAATRAGCAATGAYTVVQNGARYALNAPPAGGLPLVYGGTATIQRYTGCGATTAMQITTTGPGTLLDKPLLPALGYQLRAAGDLLLRFVGTVSQDPTAPHDPQATLLSGTATYARVTTRGTWRGKRRLTYSTKAVQVKAVPAQLRVTSDFGGAFSLSCALPGPSIGGMASRFTYLAVGARTPKKLEAARAPDKNI